MRSIALFVCLCSLSGHARATADDMLLPALPATTPQSFVVTAFENRSGHKMYDWLSALAPFLLAESLEAATSLRPAYGARILSKTLGTPVRAPAAVLRLAAERGADWVWTGWFRRLQDWRVSVSVALWRVKAGKAEKVGEGTRTGAFEDAGVLVTQAGGTLLTHAGLASRGRLRPAIPPGPVDPYALVLFGRGIAAASGSQGWVDTKQALGNLKRAVAIAPALAPAHRLLAEEYRRSGDLSNASRHFDIALAAQPRYLGALLGHAELRFARSRYQDAYHAGLAVVQERPWSVRARTLVGRALWRTGNREAAEKVLSELARRSPRDADVRRALVDMYTDQGRGPEMVRELKALVALRPDDVGALLDLGAAYRFAGALSDAITVYRQVVAAAPRHGDAWKQLGDIYRSSRQWSQAAECYEHAMAIKAKDPRAFFLAGRTYATLGNNAAARRAYLGAQKFSSHRTKAYNNLGTIAYRQRKLYESVWYFKQVVKDEPKNARYRYNYALVLSSLKRFSAAEKEVDVGISLDADDADLRYLRGVIALRRGDTARAKTAFTAAIERQAGHADALHNLARLAELAQPADGDDG